MSSGTPRAYTNAIVDIGNASRAVVRFSCVKCSHELEIANNDPRKHANFFGAQARKRGWDTDGHAISRVYCPECRKTPVQRTRRQIEMDSVVIPALEPPTIEGHAEPMALIEETGMPRTRGEPPMPHELTQAERMQIRGLLDRYFDDKEGCYLSSDGDGPMSDQEIAQRVGVPWGEVTKIREAAYGKILVDPAIAALRSQLASVEDGMALLVKHTHGLLAEAEERRAAMEKRIVEMRAALDGHSRGLAKAS